MATAAAEACLRKGLTLAPFGLTGPDVPQQTVTITDPDTKRTAKIKLCPSSRTDLINSELEQCYKKFGDVIAIDYTHPSAVNDNGRWYVDKKVPFVMGTTGGNREELVKCVNFPKKHYSVIAPNMGKQIVAVQHAFEELSVKFPGAFNNYKLNVVESHQKTKADTSGTAKAVIQSFKDLIGKDGNKEFDVEEDIKMLRSDEESLAFNVPEESLNGHAFHTYTMTSGDGTVEFELKHNVCGRRVYAEGTADAVKFLALKVSEDGEEGAKCFNMIDVLKAGALA